MIAITGTSRLVTLAIEVMPPMMTAPDQDRQHDAEDQRRAGAAEEAVVAAGDLARLGEGLVGLEHVAADGAEQEQRDGEDAG